MKKHVNPSDTDKAEQVSFTAQHLRLCEKQVRRLIVRGELPAYRFGSALMIKRQDLDAYVDGRRIVRV
jgi:excisionase family DNA binding protein